MTFNFDFDEAKTENPSNENTGTLKKTTEKGNNTTENKYTNSDENEINEAITKKPSNKNTGGISSTEDAIYKTGKDVKENINDKNLKEQKEEPKTGKESKTLEKVTLQEPNKASTKVRQKTSKNEEISRQLKHVTNTTEKIHNKEQKRTEESKLKSAEDKWVGNDDKQKELTKENTEESNNHKLEQVKQMDPQKNKDRIKNRVENVKEKWIERKDDIKHIKPKLKKVTETKTLNIENGKKQMKSQEMRDRTLAKTESTKRNDEGNIEQKSDKIKQMKSQKMRDRTLAKTESTKRKQIEKEDYTEHVGQEPKRIKEANTKENKVRTRIVEKKKSEPSKLKQAEREELKIENAKIKEVISKQRDHILDLFNLIQRMSNDTARIYNMIPKATETKNYHQQIHSIEVFIQKANTNNTKDLLFESLVNKLNKTVDHLTPTVLVHKMNREYNVLKEKSEIFTKMPKQTLLTEDEQDLVDKIYSKAKTNTD